MMKGKMRLTLGLIIGFLFGLTWNITWRMPYHESGGYIVIENRLASVGFIYSWSGAGYKYPPDWDVYRIRE
jgi:hypothetical protein